MHINIFLLCRIHLLVVKEFFNVDLHQKHFEKSPMVGKFRTLDDNDSKQRLIRAHIG